MNLGPGGKQPEMHNTQWIDKHGETHQQSMVFESLTDTSLKLITLKKGENAVDVWPKYVGKPKGIRIILHERGIWQEYETLMKERGERPLKLTCDKCSGKAAKEAMMEARRKLLAAEITSAYYDEDLDDDEDGNDTNASAHSAIPGAQPSDQRLLDGCCWTNLMRMQPDFQSERPKIVEIIREGGHEVIFLPKFHCELNPIEMVWSVIKKKFRDMPGRHTIEGARKALDIAMDAPTANQIRACFRHCWRFSDAYRKGMNADLAARTVQQFKSHRRILESWVMSIDAVTGSGPSVFSGQIL